MSFLSDVLWTEKYRPTELDHCILPKATLKTAQGFLSTGKIPNLLLTGPAGTGKTTMALLLANKLGYETLMINGSNEGRSIDTLRNTIANYASSMTFDGSRKCVIIDEADHIPDLTQAAMRNFIEQYHTNCSFILTCNYPNKIIEPLHSRCSRIDFGIPAKEKEPLAMNLLKRIYTILDSESIEYDKTAVLQLVVKHFPDFRRILNELQRYSATGKIDSGIFINTSENEITKLISILKEKNFTEMRNWVGSCTDLNMSDIAKKLYNIMGEVVSPESRPNLVIHLADYQYKACFAVDPQINMAAMLTSIMVDVKFL